MNLDTPVIQIKGVGDKTAAALKQAGVSTLRDLLYRLPRAYENYQSAELISDITPGKVLIKGQISDLKTRRAKRRNFTITEAIVRDHSDAIRVVWFNQSYRAKQLREGQEYYLSGEYCLRAGRYQLQNPNIRPVGSLAFNTNPFQPIYKAHGQLNSAFFARLIGGLRAEFALIPDLLPYSEESSAYTAPGTRRDALFKIHFPLNAEEVDQSRDRLAYEELFELSLAAALNKNENLRLRAPACPFQAPETQKLVSKLPFKLTDGQRRATWEILQDLTKTTPMNRLLQGDVGSGKTVVAAITAYQAICAGHQVALLAPTAVLATQHAESLHQLLSPLGVEVGLLTGATKPKKLLKSRLRSGELQLVVGTHALLTDDTQFDSLALVIIDEQHRFGVNQRQKLLMKCGAGTQETLAQCPDGNPPCESSYAPTPHILSMTATPIPRSLQLAIFGDLSVSTLKELPKNRQAISTRILSELNLAESLYPEIRAAVKRHEQVYWICKAIEDSALSETASVKKQAAKLAKTFPEARVAFLHGRMTPAEKDSVMSDFATGKTDILVSTTVVEVGVNVPGATQMVVMDAESFGLAQLHQLRGRIGRGSKASSCYLVTKADSEPSRRLRELEKSCDGFHLAELDLKLRGPGAIYGTLQHGALDLRIATLENQDLIVRASRHAQRFAAEISQNPDIMLQYNELKQNITKYQQLTTLN